jgi:hypothetical protein
MKNFFLLTVVVIFFQSATAQQHRLNVGNDWHANIFKEYYSDQDTIILFRNIDSLNREFDIMHWKYLGENKFRPIRDLNTLDGLVDPAIMKVMKWKVTNSKSKNYILFQGGKKNLKFWAQGYYHGDKLYKILLIRLR